MKEEVSHCTERLIDWIREFKRHVLASGDCLVHMREGVNLVLQRSLLGLVQMDLLDLLSVQLDSDALANNFGGVDQIGKVTFVDSSESAGTRALLLLQQTVLATEWLGDDSALKASKSQYNQVQAIIYLGQNDDVTATEFLFQFTDQFRMTLLEIAKLRERNPNNDAALVSMFQLLKYARH
jgi:hypothetical protein